MKNSSCKLPILNEENFRIWSRPLKNFYMANKINKLLELDDNGERYKLGESEIGL